MTPELRWLLFAALLAGSLWVPYVVGVNVTEFAAKASSSSARRIRAR